MTNLKEGKELEYSLNKPSTNGVYAFVLNVKATINGQSLDTRDGLGVWDIEKLQIKADSDTEILLMEVPMN